MAGAYRYPCLISGFIGVARLQIHIHKRRFTGLIEALSGYHRIVPVENLAFRPGICRRRRVLLLPQPVAAAQRRADHQREK